MDEIEPTPYTKPYWSSANEEGLKIPQCSKCLRFVFPPRVNCPSCFGRKFEWVRIIGTGQVITYTIVHDPPYDFYNDKVPYIIAVIRLKEGPQLLGNVINCAIQSIDCGSQVKVVYENRHGQKCPQFELV